MKIKHIMKVVILIFIFVLLTSTISSAVQINYNQESEVLKIADIDISKNELSGIYGPQGQTYNNVGGKIISIVQYICYGVAVIVLIYKGVQFMTKAPEGKAEIKKELVSCAIGALILFAIGTFIKIIGSIALNDLF